MNNFMLGGIGNTDNVLDTEVDTVEAEDNAVTVPIDEVEKTQRQKDAENYKLKVEDKHGRDIVAPPVGTTPDKDTDWAAITKQENEANAAKIQKFEENQYIEMDSELLLTAGKAGKDKGLTVKQSEQLLRSKGYQVADGAIRDELLLLGTQHGKTDKVAEAYGIPTNDANAWQRAGQEMIKVGAEIGAGITSLTNETDLTYELQTLAKDMTAKETAWKNKNVTINEDGSLNRPWNVAGGAGEALVYATVGAATGNMSTLPNVAMKTAALTDMVLASSMDTARYVGSEEFGKGDLAFSLGANLVGFGLARYMLTPKTPKLDKVDIKAFNLATMEQKAYVVEFYNWAEKNNMKLLNADVDDFDTVSAMFLAEAKKNFTTADVLADQLKGNMKGLYKVTHEMMGGMTKAKEVTPSMANNIKQAILNKETEMDNYMKQAYQDLASVDPKTATIPGDVLLDNYKHSTTYKQLANTPAGREAIKQAEELAIDFERKFAPSDIYELIKSVNDLSFGTQDKTLGKAYAQLADYLDDTMGKLAELQGSRDFMDKLEFAKGLAKEKGELFGFNKNRVNADIPDLPKIIKEGDPDKVMKLVLDNPRTFEAIDQFLPAQTKKDLQDFVLGGILDKNTKRGKVASESSLNFSGIASDLDKLDIRTMKKLFGEDRTVDLQMLSTMSGILGKQYNMETAGGNVLGALAEKGRLSSKFKEGPLGWLDYAANLFGKRKAVKALAAKDRVRLRSKIGKLQKELEAAGVQDNRGVINQVVNNIEETAPVAKTVIKREDYGSVENMANSKSPTDAATQLKLDDKDIKAQTTQVQRDYSRVNEAVTAEARAHGFSRELKTKYNELRQKFTSAKHKGDLDGMSKVTGEIDDLYDSIIADNIKRAEKAALADLERVKAKHTRAEERAAQAREAARQEVNNVTKQNRDLADIELRDAEIDTEIAQAGVEEVVNRARNVASTLPRSIEGVPETIANQVTSFEKNLGDGWAVTNMRGHGSKHLYMNNSTSSSSFVLHLSSDGKRLTATTTGLNNGSGAGSTVYPAIWDFAESIGATYTPDRTLLTANPVRMTYNMLKYMTERGSDANHIRIGRSQMGSSAGRGSRNLSNQPLTIENAKRLARQLTRVLKTRTGVEITGNMTQEEIVNAGRQLGGSRNIRLGERSVRLLNKLMSSNQTLLGMTGILALLLQDGEIEELLKEKDNSFLSGGI